MSIDLEICQFLLCTELEGSHSHTFWGSFGATKFSNLVQTSCSSTIQILEQILTQIYSCQTQPERKLASETGANL